jgi:hypothetical protein
MTLRGIVKTLFDQLRSGSNAVAPGISSAVFRNGYEKW